jgi:hypothetical protein
MPLLANEWGLYARLAGGASITCARQASLMRKCVEIWPDDGPPMEPVLLRWAREMGRVTRACAEAGCEAVT